MPRDGEGAQVRRAGGEGLGRWIDMLRRLGVWESLSPDDDLVVALRQGREPDAMEVCRRRSVEAQDHLDTFIERHQHSAREYQRLRQHDMWLD
jgi:hypothetical protein